MTTARSTVPAALHIRPMTPADVGAASAVLRAGGWPERTAFFGHLLDVPTCQPLVGEVGGAVVATGIATACGKVGWVGSIFVDHRLRRHGYGQAMTKAVCERLEAAGCETLALIASEYGQPVYERMGFRIDAWHDFYTAPARPAPTPPSVRLAAADDWPAIVELDRRATGCDRSALLLSAPGSTWVSAGCSGVAGFLCSIDPAWGAIVCDDTEGAGPLLDVLRSHAPHVAHAVIDGEDRARHAILCERGWTLDLRSPRMIRGPAVEWHPELLWGLISRAFG